MRGLDNAATYGAIGRHGAHVTRFAVGRDCARAAAEMADAAVPQLDEVVDHVSDAAPVRCAYDVDGAAGHAHDSGDEWTVRAGEGSVSPEPTFRQAEATATATASDLLLLLWGRRSPDQVQVDGDTAALQRFLARAAF